MELLGCEKWAALRLVPLVGLPSVAPSGRSANARRVGLL